MSTKVIGNERFFSLVLIVVAAIFINALTGMEEATEPGELSAATYPTFILGCIIFFNVMMIIRSKQSDAEKATFTVKGLALIVILAGYIYLLEAVGYFVLTPIILTILPLLAGYRNIKSILISVVFVVAALYIVFKTVLSIPLPMGILASLLGGI